MTNTKSAKSSRRREPMRYHYGIIDPNTLCSWQGVIEGPNDSIPATRAVNAIRDVIRETYSDTIGDGMFYVQEYQLAYVVVIRPESQTSEGTADAISRILEEERALIQAGKERAQEIERTPLPYTLL